MSVNEERLIKRAKSDQKDLKYFLLVDFGIDCCTKVAIAFFSPMLCKFSSIFHLVRRGPARGNCHQIMQTRLRGGRSVHSLPLEDLVDLLIVDVIKSRSSTPYIVLMTIIDQKRGTFLLFSRGGYRNLCLFKTRYCFVRAFEAEFSEGLFMLKRRPPAGNTRRVAPIDKNSRGTFVNKAGRTVQFESFAERTLSLRFERDPRVLDYSSQPVQFTFQDEQDKWHSYTPDFQVWKSDGTVEIHEVTRTERYSHPRMSRREVAADDLCKVEGWTYIVHTEETLPQPSEAANLLGLWRYRPTCYADSAVTTAARELLRHPMPFGKLLSLLGSRLILPEPCLVPCLGHLLWHGTLSTDFNILIVEDGNILPGVSIWFPQ